MNAPLYNPCLIEDEDEQDRLDSHPTLGVGSSSVEEEEKATPLLDCMGVMQEYSNSP